MPPPTPTKQAEEIAERVAMNFISIMRAKFIVFSFDAEIDIRVRIKQILFTELNLPELLSRPSICNGTGACPDGKCLMCQLVEARKELEEEKVRSYHIDYAKAKAELIEARKDTAMLKKAGHVLCQHLAMAIDEMDGDAPHQPQSCGTLGKPLCRYHQAIRDYVVLSQAMKGTE